MIKVIMHGCNGRMGQVITEICREDPNVGIVAGIDLNGSAANDYSVFANISLCDVKADVIIDFSNAQAVDDLLIYSVRKADSGCALYNRAYKGAACAGGEGFFADSNFKVREHVAWHQSFAGIAQSGGVFAHIGRNLT